jgi:uncharacterized protein DUF3667
MTTSPPICPNCGAARLGPYCQNCGQPEPVRLTIRGFLTHLAGRFFSLDRGVLRTAVALFKSPGHVSLEFVEGRRIWYTNPLAYWLIAATLQLVALWSIQDAYVGYLISQMQASLGDQPEAIELYAKLFKVDDPIPVLAQITADAVRAAYTYLGIFLAVAFALAMRLFVNTPSSRFNVAEHLVFALYTVAHWSIITAFLLPLTFRISPTLHATIGTTGYLIMSFWGSLEFHQAGWRGGVRTALSMAAAFLVYMVVFLGYLVVMYGIAAFKAT